MTDPEPTRFPTAAEAAVAYLTAWNDRDQENMRAVVAETDPEALAHAFATIILGTLRGQGRIPSDFLVELGHGVYRWRYVPD